MRKYILILIVLLFLLIQCTPRQSVQRAGNKYCDKPVVIQSVYGDYDEIWDDLKMALNERGLVISSVSHVGEMIERTGKALGRNRKIYGKAKVMEFCSAVISRNMLEKNPHYLSFCPYQIMVYTLPDDERKVYLSYRHLIWRDKGDDDVLEAVEDLLNEMVNEVIELHKEYR